MPNLSWSIRAQNSRQNIRTGGGVILSNILMPTILPKLTELYDRRTILEPL